MKRYADGTAVRCAIRCRDEVCGTVGLERISPSGTGEIGYWIGESFEGNGIATRATKAMADFAFELGLHRVELRMEPTNLRSEAVAKRLGYVKEGTARGASLYADEHRDEHVYAMLRRDWDV